MKSTIGERIRILRLIKSLSQENMANELDISVASYSNIERDAIDLTVSRLIKIAKILGVKPAEILEMDSEVISDTEPSKYKNATQIENSIRELKSQISKISSELESLKPQKPVRKKKRS